MILGDNPGARFPGYLEARLPSAAQNWFWAVGAGLVMAGILALMLAVVAVGAVEIWGGWLLGLGGALMGAGLLRHRQPAPEGLMQGLSAAWRLLSGAFLVWRPWPDDQGPWLVLALYFLAEGGLRLVFALGQPWPRRWGWLLAAGLGSLGLGAVTLLSWLTGAVGPLGFCLGLELILTGLTSLALARSLGRMAPGGRACPGAPGWAIRRPGGAAPPTP